MLLLVACTARNPAFEMPSEAGVADDDATQMIGPELLPDAGAPDAAGRDAALPEEVAPDSAAAPDVGPDLAPPIDVAPDLAPDVAPPVALLVVGDTSLSASDTQLRDHLKGAGFVVTTASSANAKASDADGTSLVVISGSSVSADVNSKFRDVALPVVVFDDAVFGPMKLTGTKDGTDYGSVLGDKRVAIVQPSNPLAAGLSGTINVTDANIEVSWGVPSVNAIRVATVAGQSTHYTLFAYTTGATMVGMEAPARRVGAFVRFPDTAAYTSDGLRLFDAIVRWAMTPD